MEPYRKNRPCRIVSLSDRPDMADAAVVWFHARLGVPEKEYRDSMAQALRGGAVPQWYLCLSGETIVGGAGVIDNDFHDRTDLTPNVCALYVEAAYRGRGIAGRLLRRICRDLKAQGMATLYLVTELTGFYEKYGWIFSGTARGDDDSTLRVYRHTEP